MTIRNDKPTGKRGAAYIRVSHGEKQDPERQRETIRAWAGKRKLAITRWYEDVEGRNPRDRAECREQFQQLIAEVQAGQIDWIVVDSQDRWGVKDQLEFGYFGHILRQNDCELWSVAQGHLTGTDDAAVFTTTVGNVTSTREQREKGQRAISGKRRSAAIGEWQGGHVPYGYDVACVDRASGVERWRVVILKMVPKQGIWHRVIVYPDKRQERCDGDGRFPRKQDWEKFVLSPSVLGERVEKVREIFTLFATGSWTVRGLCDRLNRKSVDPVVGVGWYHTRLKPMLQNPAYYVGQTVYGKLSHGRHAWYVEGEYLVPPRVKGRAKMGRRNKVEDWVFPPPGEALIEKDLWDKVQERLNSEKPAIKRGLRDERLWLAGLVVCGRCGQRMAGHAQGGLAYVCQTYIKYGKSNKSGCRLHRVQQAKLEEMIGRYIDDVGPALKLVLEGGDCPQRSAAARQYDEGDAEVMSILGRMANWLRSQGISLSPDRTELIEEIYEREWEAEQERFRRELATEEAGLRRLVLNMNRLSDEDTEAVAIQQQLIREANTRVEGLRRQTVSLMDELETATTKVMDAMETLERLKADMAGDDARRKALALRRAVDRIVCTFNHYDHRTQDRRSTTDFVQRSTLASVQIVPVNGSPQTLTVGRQPEPG